MTHALTSAALTPQHSHTKYSHTRLHTMVSDQLACHNPPTAASKRKAGSTGCPANGCCCRTCEGSYCPMVQGWPQFAPDYALAFVGSGEHGASLPKTGTYSQWPCAEGHCVVQLHTAFGVLGDSTTDPYLGLNIRQPPSTSLH